jgi:RNA polymerase sigma factor (sigma-70 family)
MNHTALMRKNRIGNQTNLLIYMKQLSTYTDAELVQLYKKKPDTEIVGELYKRYSLMVFGLCYKYLKDEDNARDAVSEIFELILKKLRTHEVLFFRSWLFMVSKNYLMRKKGNKKMPEILEIEKIPEKFMENREDLSLYIRERESTLLQQAMERLNEDQRICIELFYLRQKPYQEVAFTTGYDLNKVKSCIQNGKRNLKLFIEERT